MEHQLLSHSPVCIVNLYIENSFVKILQNFVVSCCNSLFIPFWLHNNSIISSRFVTSTFEYVFMMSKKLILNFYGMEFQGGL